MTTITHPERILYPEVGITKQDLVDYYESAQGLMLPYINKRLITLVRCPQGQQAKGFFQKHLNETTDALFTIEVEEKSGSADYFYLKNAAGLIDIVQMSALEIHCWGSHIDKLEKPDVLIFDLDPAPNVKWNKVVAAALLIREKLAEIDIVSFVKTTGGKGLHVVAPVKPNKTWDKFKLFAHEFVEMIAREHPKDFTTNMSKDKRTGKIFLDYLRNQRGATAVAAYSTRATPTATVSAPITWDELEGGVKSLDFTVKSMKSRLKKDAWEGYFGLKQKL